MFGIPFINLRAFRYYYDVYACYIATCFIICTCASIYLSYTEWACLYSWFVCSHESGNTHCNHKSKWSTSDLESHQMCCYAGGAFCQGLQLVSTHCTLLCIITGHVCPDARNGVATCAGSVVLTQTYVATRMPLMSVRTATSLSGVSMMGWRMWWVWCGALGQRWHPTHPPSQYTRPSTHHHLSGGSGGQLHQLEGGVSMWRSSTKWNRSSQ